MRFIESKICVQGTKSKSTELMETNDGFFLRGILCKFQKFKM